MTTLAVPPRQRRSRESAERILVAVLELIETGGADAVTMSAVAAASGVSIGAIYGRFKDKETLLLAAQERHLDSVRADIEQRLAGLRALGAAPAAEVVAGFVGLAVATFAAREALIGRFVTLAAVNPAIRSQASEVLGTASAAIATQAAAHPELFGVRDPASAVDIVFRTVVATLERRVTTGPAFLSTHALGWEDLDQELSSLAIRYLCPSPYPVAKG